MTEDELNSRSLTVTTAPIPLDDDNSRPSDIYREIMKEASPLLLPNSPERQKYIREAVNAAVTAGDVYYAEALQAKRMVAMLVFLLAESDTGEGRIDIVRTAPDGTKTLYEISLESSTEGQHHATLKIPIPLYLQYTGTNHGLIATVTNNEIREMLIIEVGPKPVEETSDAG